MFQSSSFLYVTADWKRYCSPERQSSPQGCFQRKNHRTRSQARMERSRLLRQWCEQRHDVLWSCCICFAERSRIIFVAADVIASCTWSSFWRFGGCYSRIRGSSRFCEFYFSKSQFWRPAYEYVGFEYSNRIEYASHCFRSPDTSPWLHFNVEIHLIQRIYGLYSNTQVIVHYSS